MKFLANDLFRSLALGFLLGSAGMAAAFAAGPVEAAVAVQTPANAVSQ